MISSRLRTSLRNTGSLFESSLAAALYHGSPQFLSVEARKAKFDDREGKSPDSTKLSEIVSVIARVHRGSSDNEIFRLLSNDPVCNSIIPSQDLVELLLRRFKDDWKSALGVFRWAGSCSGYEHAPGVCDMMVDIVGKMKQMDQMRALLEELHQSKLLTLSAIGKAMRRFSGAGQWEDAVRMFDELTKFGLEKNTESMNLLLDTLCKERKVEQAREVFMELKSHISPNANSFNIFIHGWCKVNRVEEAHWTIEEMKGQGFRPCVISYSTIVQFYCRGGNFSKVYEVLDEMEAQGCAANVITYTTFMSSLIKAEEYDEALQVARRVKSVGCKPDTLFYNCLIHVLGRSGKLKEAVDVFEKEMPGNGVLPNTSTYNSMIAMFCRHKQEAKALHLLKKMETLMICKPDVHTYYPLLKSCFRTGKVDDLLSRLLNDMVDKHHLSLDLSSYTLLIHGLCRANKCEWAYRLFEEMIDLDMKPKHKTCHLLLEEVQQKDMHGAADRIEDFMKKL